MLRLVLASLQTAASLWPSGSALAGDTRMRGCREFCLLRAVLRAVGTAWRNNATT